MAIVMTTTPQLYIFLRYWLMMDVSIARDRSMSLSYVLLLRSNVASLRSRMIVLIFHKIWWKNGYQRSEIKKNSANIIICDRILLVF